MKNIITLSIALLTFVFTNAQETSKKTTTKTTTKTVKAAVAKVDGAGMVFDKETIDYGKIAHNADGKREFVFTNNGNKPLIITNAQGSCGCTVPSFPKEPIAPGAKGVIGVKYATDRIGPFTKTITLTSNVKNDIPTVEGQPAPASTKILTIKGEVLGDDAPKS